MSQLSKSSAVSSYFRTKIDDLTTKVRKKEANVRRLEAQRNDLNAKVRVLKDELVQLCQPGSSVGEVIKKMGQNKVLVKIHPDGKYIVTLTKISIFMILKFECVSHEVDFSENMKHLQSRERNG